MGANRQLAAILFADIAGYTAMMQENEQIALEKLNHFKRDIQNIVPQFKGRIVQFYGDGCLLIFNSVLNAVQCSIRLQESLKIEPTVPVRIGAHQGDVILESDNVFGDSVNIAARIESMSVPGAVLLSEKVRNELKNQPDIELVSLGSFEFKNVNEPVEVFAICKEGFPVPARKEIKGKFKEKNKEKSIAVLAFENRSSDPDQEYFSDGMAEEIIYGLSQLENLKVASRTASFTFKNTSCSLKEIAAELKVEAILVGSVRKAGKRVRVGVELVNVEDGFQLWAGRFDRQLEDIFAIQDEIAEEVIRNLELTLLGKEKGQPFINRKTNNVEAYEFYLQGRNCLDQRMHSDEALAFFNKAVSIDPDFAAAYTSIAYAYFYKVVFANYPPREGWAKVEQAIQRALQLDSTIAEAHTMQALVDFYCYHKWEKARQEYEKAIALRPKFSDTYRVKAYFHTMMNEGRAAIEMAEKAVQLDPLSFNNCLSLGDVYFREGYYEDSVKILRPLSEKYPHNRYAKEILSYAYYMMNKIEEARGVLRTLPSVSEFVSLYSTGQYVIEQHHGDIQRAEDYLAYLQEISKAKWIPPSAVAQLAFSLGYDEVGVDYYQRAIDGADPGIIYIYVDPVCRKSLGEVGRRHVGNYLQSIGLPKRE